MKKWIALLLAVLMMFSLAACGEDKDTPAGNTSTPNGGDPCVCCPDCIQKECECAECGDNTDCKCKLPGGSALTYDIVIDVENSCPYHDDSSSCGIITKGTARVTMNGSSSDGNGETIKNGMCGGEPPKTTNGDLRSYEFTAQLSISGDNKTILVGFDRLGPEEYTYNYSIWEGLEDSTSQSFFSFFFQQMMKNPTPPENGLVVYPNLETGLLIFEVPLIEGKGTEQQFKWGDNISISITLTPRP